MQENPISPLCCCSGVRVQAPHGRRRLAGACLIAVSLLTGPASAETVVASKADDVVDMIGVSIRMNSTSVFETSVLPGLQALNVRHVRGNFPDFARTYNNIPDRVQLMYDLGVRGVGLWGSNSNGFNTLPDGTPITAAQGSPEAAVEALEVLGDFAIGIEGPNEPDVFYDGYQYGGFTNTATDLAASRAYHNAMYAAIKADPDTAHVPVVTPSYAFLAGPGAGGALSHDKINLHYYPHSFIGDVARPLAGNFEGDFEDYLAANLAAQGVNPSDPTPTVLLTETGYNTSPGDPVVPGRLQGMSDLGTVKYVPRLMADLFKAGRVEQRVGDTPFYLERAYLFRLDHNKQPTNDQDYYWGIMEADGSPTPAFTALESMIDLLREATYDVAAEQWQLPDYTPAALDLTILGALPDTQHLLLQKSTGQYILMLWQDVDSYNLWQDIDLAVPDDLVTLSPAGGTFANVTQHDYDASGNLVASPLNAGASLTVVVPDAVTFLTFDFVPSVVAGDYNNDGSVDQGDLDLVLLNWGDDAGVTGVPAGWVNDQPLGLIGQTELDGVLLNWGNTAEANVSAVPEPAVGLALLSAAGLRRRR